MFSSESGNAEDTFTKIGFNNWKNASYIIKFIVSIIIIIIIIIVLVYGFSIYDQLIVTLLNTILKLLLE